MTEISLSFSYNPIDKKDISFSYWLSMKQATSHFIKQWLISSQKYIGITISQWVNESENREKWNALTNNDKHFNAD